MLVFGSFLVTIQSDIVEASRVWLMEEWTFWWRLNGTAFVLGESANIGTACSITALDDLIFYTPPNTDNPPELHSTL